MAKNVQKFSIWPNQIPYLCTFQSISQATIGLYLNDFALEPWDQDDCFEYQKPEEHKEKIDSNKFTTDLKIGWRYLIFAKKKVQNFFGDSL